MPKPINRTMILPEEITREIESTLNETDRLVLTAWLDGKPKFEAWASVMRPGTVITAANERSIRTQASRFWNTMRLRSIADKIDAWKLDHGVAKNIKLKPNDKRQKIIIPSLPEQKPTTKPTDDKKQSSPADQDFVTSEPKDTKKPDKKSSSQGLAKKRSYSEQRQAWLESFQDIENPSATTPYGIGLWLGSRVLAQVNKREQWIERHTVSAAAAEQGTDTGDDHALGALHEPYLTLDGESLGTGTYIAHHDGAYHGREGDDTAPHIAVEQQVDGDAEEGEQLAVAVEGGVPQGTEGALHAAHTGQTAVDHVEQTGEEDDGSAPADQVELLRCIDGGIDEQGRGQQIEQQTDEGDDVRGDVQLDQGADERVDHMVDHFLKEVSVVHACMSCLLYGLLLIRSMRWVSR